MRFKQLDLNLLVALDRLLTLKSVSAAADQMNMSQSAMSSALSRLRLYFKDPLLVQVGRAMHLTATAEAIQGAVRDILVRIESTIDIRPSFDPTGSDREFQILVSDYTICVLVPHVLAIAAEQGAKVRFRFLATAQKPFALLEKGEADLLVAPHQLCALDHPCVNLFSDDYVAVVWEAGP